MSQTQTHIDHTGRFSGRAENYKKYRSGYPKEIVDFMAAKLPIRQGDKILDLGSGTGILSEELLRDLHESLAISVAGVEPNADMRATQETELKAWIDKGAFSSVGGTAEDTTLQPGTFDVAVAAAAFHWFDGPKARAEILRTVKQRDGKGAPVALIVSYDGDLDVPPEMENARQVHLALQEMRRRTTLDLSRRLHENKSSAAALDVFFGGHDQWQDMVRPTTVTRAWDEVVGHVQSISTTPPVGTPENAKVIAEVKEIFDKFQVDGKLTTLRVGRLVYGYIR